LRPVFSSSAHGDWRFLVVAPDPAVTPWPLAPGHHHRGSPLPGAFDGCLGEPPRRFFDRRGSPFEPFLVPFAPDKLVLCPSIRPAFPTSPVFTDFSFPKPLFGFRFPCLWSQEAVSLVRINLSTPLLVAVIELFSVCYFPHPFPSFFPGPSHQFRRIREVWQSAVFPNLHQLVWPAPPFPSNSEKQAVTR